MTIPLDCCSLIIKRSRFQDRNAGGWEYFIGDHEPPNHAVWYDDHLVRFGTMNASDMDETVLHFQRMGLRLTVRRGGVRQFADMCVVAAMSGGLTLPCPWLSYSDDEPGERVDYVGRTAKRWRKHPIGDDFLYWGERAPPGSTGWPDETRARTRRILTAVLTNAKRWSEDVPLIHLNGNRGRLRIVRRQHLPLKLHADNGQVLDEFRNITQIILSGWSVD